MREQDGKVATIPARIENVLKLPRRTCLRNGSLLVETVEHCMAALSGMGIDNATVRVSGAGNAHASSSRPMKIARASIRMMSSTLRLAGTW